LELGGPSDRPQSAYFWVNTPSAAQPFGLAIFDCARLQSAYLKVNMPHSGAWPTAISLALGPQSEF
jgi:hypothetical protein